MIEALTDWVVNQTVWADWLFLIPVGVVVAVGIYIYGRITRG